MQCGKLWSCSWIESDRDEGEDINRIEAAFDDATDTLRDVAKKGCVLLHVVLTLLWMHCS